MPLTARRFTSKTTHSWPPFMRRRTRLDPIRPSPIIPSCMWPPLGARASLTRRRGGLAERAVAPDQGVGRAVVVELGLGIGRELGDDPLGQHLAELHAPLVERVDVPDGPLR